MKASDRFLARETRGIASIGVPLAIFVAATNLVWEFAHAEDTNLDSVVVLAESSELAARYREAQGQFGSDDQKAVETLFELGEIPGLAKHVEEHAGADCPELWLSGSDLAHRRVSRYLNDASPTELANYRVWAKLAFAQAVERSQPNAVSIENARLIERLGLRFPRLPETEKALLDLGDRFLRRGKFAHARHAWRSAIGARLETMSAEVFENHPEITARFHLAAILENPSSKRPLIGFQDADEEGILAGKHCRWPDLLNDFVAKLPKPDATPRSTWSIPPSALWTRAKSRDVPFEETSVEYAAPVWILVEGDHVIAIREDTGEIAWTLHALDFVDDPRGVRKGERIGQWRVSRACRAVSLTLRAKRSLSPQRAVRAKLSNAILVLEPSSGQRLFEKTFDLDGPFPGLGSTQGDVVYFPLVEQEASGLKCVLVAHRLGSNAELWRRPLVLAASDASPSKRVIPWPSVHLDEETILVQTELGAIASVDSVTSEPKWVAKYCRVLQPDPHEPSRKAPMDRGNSDLVWIGERLFVSPSDCAQTFAFDRFRGDLLWATNPLSPTKMIRARNQSSRLANDSTIYLNGASTIPVNVVDGKPKRDIAPEGNRLSEPTIHAGAIWQPMEDALYVYDLREDDDRDRAVWEKIAWPSGISPVRADFGTNRILLRDPSGYHAFVVEKKPRANITPSGTSN